MHEVDQRYLEDPVEIPLVHPETLDGHGASQVFPIAHVREPTTVINSPNVCELLLKNIRGGDDTTSFANLGKEQQTPLPEFDIEA